MGIDEHSPVADAQRDAFRARVEDELHEWGREFAGSGAYEAFKRLTDL